MSIWKSAIGGLIGFSLGGPLGGLIGAVIGSKFGTKNANSSTRFTSNQQQQAAFFAALFACLAKLAKADGIVSKEEVEKVDNFIKERFKFPSEQRLFAIKVFNHAKDDNVSYEEYASQLAALLASNKNALVVFYELLFELAMADGVLDSAEENLLRMTPSIFGIDLDLFNSPKNLFSLFPIQPSSRYKLYKINFNSSEFTVTFSEECIKKPSDTNFSRILFLLFSLVFGQIIIAEVSLVVWMKSRIYL